MHMIQIKAIADANGPDITGVVVPMPAGSVHLAPASFRSWYEQRADVFEILTASGTEYMQMLGVLDDDGNITGMAGPDGTLMMEFIDVGGDATGTTVEV